MVERALKTLKQYKDGLTRFLLDIASLIAYVIRRFINDGMTLLAGALTYSTLLALVPLMVIAFAILSGFAIFDPARERMEEFFFDIFVPEFGAEVGDYLAEFSRNAANLTAVGIVGLAVTAVMLLWTIEATLNQIWRVQKQRSISVRVLIYWTILTLGPLLLGASFILTSGTVATLTQWASEGVGAEQAEQAMPTLNLVFAMIAQSLTFTLLFKIVPARHVRLGDAAAGGIIAGVGVKLLGLGFDRILTQGSTYDTVYGAVAILPVFLLWLYLLWVIILFGAVFTASLPDWWKSRNVSLSSAPSLSQKLEVAVAALSIIAHNARNGQTTSWEELEKVNPLDIGDELYDHLAQQRYITITEDDRVALLRDLHITSVADLAKDMGLLLGSLHEASAETSSDAMVNERSVAAEVRRLLEALYDAETALLERSLHDVIFSGVAR